VARAVWDDDPDSFPEPDSRTARVGMPLVSLSSFRSTLRSTLIVLSGVLDVDGASPSGINCSTNRKLHAFYRLVRPSFRGAELRDPAD
jgi:hypothetical protein